MVVAFDMCSASDVIEQLAARGEMARFPALLTTLKRYLQRERKVLAFEPYKFTGDGWILLFPKDTDGPGLLALLKRLCIFFKREFQRQILDYLDVGPSLTGLTFGLEVGPLWAMQMYQQKEYVGRALNIACRLQGAVKDKGGSPAYKALVSNAVFSAYLSEIKGFKVHLAKRSLRNIQDGKEISCKKIELLPSDG